MNNFQKNVKIVKVGTIVLEPFLQYKWCILQEKIFCRSLIEEAGCRWLFYQPYFKTENHNEANSIA